ncbi:MAG: hypothetical protein FD143_3317 [Ignavibacteria bacterium]|nr:MAG: hypothetical protein FD143_3317 [Ignavibacteria bacterium]
MGKKKVNLKKTIKFLSVCKDPRIIRGVLKRSPNNVIKTLCNATINAAQGEINLKNSLIKRGETVEKKRKLLVQKGGGPILAAVLPIVLNTVLSAIGSRLFGNQ